MSTTDDTSAPRRGSGSNDLLGLLVNRALFADECQRLAEWALIGPVQRAALESFAERLLAAERERWLSAIRSALNEEGFGCACVPHYRCGPCRLSDAMGPNAKAERPETAAKE